ncbi:MAG: sigma-E factor negative regulatory protein [Thiohalophilus sp.]|uniref:sigma-E factor negative regulatory protein n=1 Tax=Thiohalophilus sp. TaxID=3028392 RepID=UPI00286FDC16|nr:sigma-E factor negative regulatory protein [Thiohalophilus sp.]MDR9436939.1 sigma-E factor negative regulatory protein [Thiohalophilus sp.]
MSNNSDEKLSAFMDDEYHPEVLESLKQDTGARARWTRYHLIRDVLSGHSQTVPSSDFADRVSAAIREEPTVLRPAARRFGQGLRQVAGLAIAATVATVAVLTVQQSPPGNSAAQPSIASTQSQSGSDEYLTVSGNPTPSQEPIDSEVQSKLSSYLVNHNEYSISSRMQGMLPYMRIVSVTPSQRVAGADEK